MKKMKTIGFIRPVDELGRLVLPKEIRMSFDLKPKDSVEIFTNGDEIILKKYAPSCIFCGSDKDLADFNGKPLCSSCISEIGALRPGGKE